MVDSEIQVNIDAVTEECANSSFSGINEAFQMDETMVDNEIQVNVGAVMNECANSSSSGINVASKLERPNGLFVSCSQNEDCGKRTCDQSMETKIFSVSPRPTVDNVEMTSDPTCPPSTLGGSDIGVITKKIVE